MMKYGVIDTGWSVILTECMYGNRFFQDHPGYSDICYTHKDAFNAFKQLYNSQNRKMHFYYLFTDEMINIAAVTAEMAYRLQGYIGPYDSPQIAYGVAEIQRISGKFQPDHPQIQRSIFLKPLRFDCCIEYNNSECYLVHTTGPYKIPILAKRAQYSKNGIRTGELIIPRLTGNCSDFRIFHTPEELEQTLRIPSQILISDGAYELADDSEPTATVCLTGRVIESISPPSRNEYVLDIDSLEAISTLYLTSDALITKNDFIYVPSVELSCQI